MRWAIFVAVAACTAQDAAPPPIDYSLYILTEQPRASDPPTVFIDGAPAAMLQQTYASRTEAGDFEHRVELRYQDQVLAAMDVTSTPEECGPGPASTGAVLAVKVDIAEYDSGDLRYASEQDTFEHGACVGDGFGAAHCSCASSERCMPRILRESPLFTQLACAPIGTKQHGDACAIVPDPAGAYDDCGAGLFCYQGTCHMLCTNGAGTELPDAYPPDARLCD